LPLYRQIVERGSGNNDDRDPEDVLEAGQEGLWPRGSCAMADSLGRTYIWGIPGKNEEFDLKVARVRRCLKGVGQQNKKKTRRKKKKKKK